MRSDELLFALAEKAAPTELARTRAEQLDHGCRLPWTKVDGKTNIVNFFRQDISSTIQLLEDSLGGAWDLLLEGKNRVVRILCVIGRVGQLVEGSIAAQHRDPRDR